ncbi:hypothetical protein HD806DRAFT_544049 [Xylariaceae sp. AK1471]|nr:hypothetical protein HD806DRAFT_544049 [Xylariaceae sp. AK1471]
MSNMSTQNPEDTTASSLSDALPTASYAASLSTESPAPASDDAPGTSREFVEIWESGLEEAIEGVLGQAANGISVERGIHEGCRTIVISSLTPRQTKARISNAVAEVLKTKLRPWFHERTNVRFTGGVGQVFIPNAPRSRRRENMTFGGHRASYVVPEIEEKVARIWRLSLSKGLAEIMDGVVGEGQYTITPYVQSYPLGCQIEVATEEPPELEVRESIKELARSKLHELSPECPVSFDFRFGCFRYNGIASWLPTWWEEADGQTNGRE